MWSVKGWTVNSVGLLAHRSLLQPPNSAAIAGTHSRQYVKEGCVGSSKALFTHVSSGPSLAHGRYCADPFHGQEASPVRATYFCLWLPSAQAT